MKEDRKQEMANIQNDETITGRGGMKEQKQNEGRKDGRNEIKKWKNEELKKKDKQKEEGRKGKKKERTNNRQKEIEIKEETNK
jgi:hypothetical protein